MLPLTCLQDLKCTLNDFRKRSIYFNLKVNEKGSLFPKKYIYICFYKFLSNYFIQLFEIIMNQIWSLICLMTLSLVNRYSLYIKYESFDTIILFDNSCKIKYSDFYLSQWYLEISVHNENRIFGSSKIIRHQVFRWRRI